MFVNQNTDAYDRRTDTYIVVYIDILGMTNRIKEKRPIDFERALMRQR